MVTKPMEMFLVKVNYQGLQKNFGSFWYLQYRNVNYKANGVSGRSGK
jgi:hypothetical protein